MYVELQLYRRWRRRRPVVIIVVREVICLLHFFPYITYIAFIHIGLSVEYIAKDFSSRFIDACVYVCLDV